MSLVWRCYSVLALPGPDGLADEQSTDRKPLSSRTHTHTRRWDSCLLLMHDSITESELINIPKRASNEHMDGWCIEGCPLSNLHITCKHRNFYWRTSVTDAALLVHSPSVSFASVPVGRWARVMRKSSTSYLFHVICTTSFSMSSASPFSKGSAIMVILFLSITSHSCQSLTLGGRTDWCRIHITSKWTVGSFISTEHHS